MNTLKNMYKDNNIAKRKKLFLFANSYATRTILYHANYLFDFQMSEIYLLSENHTREEKLFIKNDVAISFCERIEDAIMNADITVALIDDNIPNSKLSNVIDYSSSVGKQCIVINNPWIDSSKKDTNKGFIENKKLDYGKKPVILLISTGRFADLYYTELLINRLLFEENVSFIQEFSKSTLHLISQLSHVGVVRESILKSLSFSYSQASIIVKSMLLEELANESYLECINPDFVLMTCLSDYQSVDQVSNFFIYKYGRSIDLFLYLPYIAVEKYENAYIPVYCGQFKKYAAYCGVNVYSEQIDKTIKDAMLAKIAIPEGMRII